MKKSILSAVLCLWIACLKVCDKGDGLSSCICGNSDPELTFGMGRAFRNAPQPETASQISASEWDAVSGSGLKRKLRPGIEPRGGTHFPDGMLGGNYGPVFGSRTGYIFQNGPRAAVYRPFRAPLVELRYS